VAVCREIARPRTARPALDADDRSTSARRSLYRADMRGGRLAAARRPVHAGLQAALKSHVEHVCSQPGARTCRGPREGGGQGASDAYGSVVETNSQCPAPRGHSCPAEPNAPWGSYRLERRRQRNMPGWRRLKKRRSATGSALLGTFGVCVRVGATHTYASLVLGDPRFPVLA